MCQVIELQFALLFTIFLLVRLQLQVGYRFLDPFCFKVAEVMDIFPRKEENEEAKNEGNTFDLAVLSPFCFPNGVRHRLVPRSAFDSAKRLGWIDTSNDKFNSLVVRM